MTRDDNITWSNDMVTPMTDDLKARTDALLTELLPLGYNVHLGQLMATPHRAVTAKAAALIRDYQAELSFYETRYREIAQREADLINALSASEAVPTSDAAKAAVVAAIQPHLRAAFEQGARAMQEAAESVCEAKHQRCDIGFKQHFDHGVGCAREAYRAAGNAIRALDPTKLEPNNG